LLLSRSPSAPTRILPGWTGSLPSAAFSATPPAPDGVTTSSKGASAPARSPELKTVTGE